MADTSYCDQGTPAIKLIEECAELIQECTKLIQAVTKGERFGWDSCHPDLDITNYEQLKHEYMDVNRAYDVLVDHIVKVQEAQLLLKGWFSDTGTGKLIG